MPQPRTLEQIRKPLPRPPQQQEATAFYHTARWLRMRQIVINEEPMCRMCQVQPTTDVDHILSLAKRPDLALVRTNLRGLCHECHSAVTFKESAHAG